MSNLKDSTVIDVETITSDPQQEIAERKTIKGIKEICKEFMDNVTVHGLSYLLNATTILQRLLWVLLVLAALSYVLFISSKSIYRYFERPTITKVIMTHDAAIAFPAVTICDLNPYNRIALEQDPDSRFLQAANLLKSSYILEHINPPEMNGSDMIKLVKDYGMLLEAILRDCKWKKSPCDASNFSRMVSPSLGLCYTFNKGKDGHRLLYSDNPGADYGLQISLALDQNAYLEGSEVAGFKILLHDQDVPPKVNNLGFAVSPGTRTYVAVKKHVVKNLPAPYQNPCREDKSKLPSGEPYSHSGCIDHCLAVYLNERCGCVYYGMLSEKVTSQICSLHKTLNCLIPSKDSFSRDVESFCHCKEPCESVEYIPSLSYAQAPSLSTSRSLWESYKLFSIEGAMNISEGDMLQTLRSSWVDVSIFYQELHYQQTEQIPEFTEDELLGSVGGQIGLFLGASLLSLYEFVDLFFNIVLVLSKRCKSEEISKTKI